MLFSQEDRGETDSVAGNEKLNVREGDEKERNAGDGEETKGGA